jgi:hypothetical protein
MVRYIKDEAGFDLPFIVRDRKTGDRFPLSGYTITFFMWLPDAVSSKVNGGAVVIDDAANGECHYVVQAGDFDTVGSYNWELRLVAGAVERKARSNGNIEIKEEAP